MAVAAERQSSESTFVHRNNPRNLFTTPRGQHETLPMKARFLQASS